MKKCSTFLIVLIVPGLFAGCKPSYESIVKERAAQIDEFDQELKSIAAEIPDQAPLFSDVASLAPLESLQGELPYFHIKDDNSNTILLFTDIMASGKGNWADSHYNFPGTANDTLQKIANPPEGRDNGWLANRIDQLLNARYLIALNLKKSEKIELVDDKKFSGGRLLVTCHLYDRQAGKFISHIAIQGIPKSGYAFGQKNTLETKIRSDIKSNAKENICEQLNLIIEKQTGGFIEFDYEAPGKSGESIPYTWEIYD